MCETEYKLNNRGISYSLSCTQDGINDISFKYDENFLFALKNDTSPILEIMEWRNSSDYKDLMNCWNFYIDRMWFSIDDIFNKFNKFDGFEYLNNLLNNEYVCNECKKEIICYLNNEKYIVPKSEEKIKMEKHLEEVHERKERERLHGYVYLVYSNDYYKIGRSKDLNRPNYFGVIMPYETMLIHNFKSNDYYFAEEYLHKQFSSKRYKGEWFLLTEQDIEYIKSIQDYQL